MKELGCDTIKFLMSSDDAFQRGGAQTLMYSEDEAQAIGRASADEGIWLACHAQAAEAVKRAARAGFRAIFHCTHADEEALELLEAGRERHFIAPAPACFTRDAMRLRILGSDPMKPSQWARASALMR